MPLQIAAALAVKKIMSSSICRDAEILAGRAEELLGTRRITFAPVSSRTSTSASSRTSART